MNLVTSSPRGSTPLPQPRSSCAMLEPYVCELIKWWDSSERVRRVSLNELLLGAHWGDTQETPILDEWRPFSALLSGDTGNRTLPWHKYIKICYSKSVDNVPPQARKVLAPPHSCEVSPRFLVILDGPPHGDWPLILVYNLLQPLAYFFPPPEI